MWKDWDREKKYDVILNFIDKTSFFRIFFVWFMLVMSFAFIYHLTSSSTFGNLITNKGNEVTGMFDYIYYSFITATSTGYGDIIPHGTGMRVLAVANVIVGMLMMAIVTSKLVSMKQEKLLEQIYNISFSEKVSRILGGLTLFKGEAERIKETLNENEIIDRKMLFSIKMTMSSLKAHLNDIKAEMVGKKKIIRRLERPQIDQLLSGLSQAFNDLSVIVKSLEKVDVTFKSPALLEEIYHITNIGTQILNHVKEDFPFYNQRIIEIQKIVNHVHRSIMTFKIIDLEKEIEVNISPDIMVKP